MPTITNTGSNLASNFTIFGVTFNIKLVIFILGSIAFGIAGIMYFNSSQQYIGMAVFIPLTLLILIVYGNRWFGPTGSANMALKSWPPQINTCPDYLTAYTIIGTSGTTAQKGCVDLIGVSTNGGFTKTTDPKMMTATATNFFPLTLGETRQSVCARLKTAGLSWEGVSDGSSCLSPDGSGTSVVPGSTCSTTD
jgi:hypothetical protein